MVKTKTDESQMSAGGARPPLAPRAGPEARQRHHEKLIVQLESELSATVQRLEAQRTSQQEEVERLNRDLLAVCEDRQELRARADLAEQQVQTFREELQHQLALWAQERLELEKRAADAEAAANAARQSEGRIMAQAAALDSRIVAAQADRKHAQEKDRLRTELERRTASQADQITQLRDKLAQLSAQLAESARAKLEQEAETKRQISENATLVAENHRLAVASGEANKAREDLLAERERANSAKASLESALRLNETREKQITALQDAVHAEREKSTRMENARLQEIDLLRHQVDSLQQQCKQTERLRAEQIASFQDQLREQRAHTLRLTEELSTLENRHQRDHAQYDRTSSDDDVDVTNRFSHKALSGQKRHDATSEATMRAQANEQSSFFISDAVDLNPRRHRPGNTGGTSVSATTDIDDNRDDDHRHDNNDAHNSLVSDYISRILDQTRDLDTSTHRLNESEDGFDSKTMHYIPGRRPPTAVSVPVARRSSKAAAKTSKKQASKSRTATARPAAATRTALASPSGLVNSRTKKIVKKKKKKANPATSATAVSKKSKKKARQENGPLPMENQRKDPFDKLQVARWRF